MVRVKRLQGRLERLLPSGNRAIRLAATLQFWGLGLLTGLFTAVSLTKGSPLGFILAVILAIISVTCAFRFIMEGNSRGYLQLACPQCGAFVNLALLDWRTGDGMAIPVEDARERDEIDLLVDTVRRLGCPHCGCHDLLICVPPEEGER
jgi:hypothetical protein